MNILREKAVVKTYNKFTKLPLGAVTPRGWLREQLQRNKEGFGGHMDELEPDLLGTPWINYKSITKTPFLGEVADWVAAGWGGELSGLYWTGLVQLAYTLQDKELIEKASRWVEGVLKHQEPDGYLGTFPANVDRNKDYNPWGAAWGYRALLSFHEATGRQDVLDAVYGGLLWFCDNWKNHKTDYAGPLIMEPMIIVYGYTGDRRLVEFCEDWQKWLEDNSRWQNKVSQYLSDKLPYLSMHAVAYGEEVKNPALIYCVTGEEKLLEASLNGTRKALRRVVQTTGGVSSCSEFLSPKGAANETEYCNYATFQHTYSWLALLTGEGCWADEMERSLFNGAQGARKKDERAIAYFTSPNQLQANRDSSTYADWAEYGVYTPCYHVPCCCTNAVRLIPEYLRSMIMLDKEDEVYLLCYGPADVKSPKLDFAIDTLYPFRETITLQITRGQREKLHVRIPGWCKKPLATVNGKEIELIKDGKGFARIAAALSAGDMVELHFPMEIKIVKVDDSHSASKFPISIERGPLVYALPVPVRWAEYPGNPITPLPEGWCWYEAFPDLDFSAGDGFAPHWNASWAKAVDENLTPNQIRVVETEVDGYVWEKPPVALEVPLYHAKLAHMFLSPRMGEAWEVPLDVEGNAEYCTMVPHGCTNLRITYLPRANV
ncbi:MAG: hypothetical protein E7428_05565 [Ruminococcaceae bacterium]|nr:hypothetical protein [Oscillospiraceae bacterium]